MVRPFAHIRIEPCTPDRHDAGGSRAAQFARLPQAGEVPKSMGAKSIDEWDALRNEIGDAVGGEGPDRWITVVFTGDPEWAE